MYEQIWLFDLPKYNKDTKLWRQFLEYHERNPHVYERFEDLAKEYLNKRRSTLSIALLTERIRWEENISTNEKDYKLSNNHRAYYARMFMENNPNYGNCFITKATKEE